ncbi:N-(5'-phosphoribosyl)anthranilate isomerase [Streptomyces sp. NPDC028635]|uniref:phosphoribosylanthranilate isomerase n=1 Tax=Streptomyces sp. NPDC028635 TaxID=3154800 RepID=UPI0033E7A7D2
MTLVKFCGAVTGREVQDMAAAGADLVGLWHGVPGGHADLSRHRLTELADTARAAGLTPVLVTLCADGETLTAALRAARTPWVQLHGFQPPALVRALKRHAGEDLTVVKALHLRGGRCLEAPLLGAYARTGTDVFLLDTATAGGALGSTGEPLDAASATAVADRLTRPFLLAGGLHARNRAAYARLVAHPRFLGVDVDSAARGSDGLLSAPRARAIRETWTAAPA